MSASVPEDKQVKLVLTELEALVLFEWLARVDAEKSAPLIHPAEQKLLWLLETQLEKELVQPFLPNYTELVEKAREEIVSEE